MAFRLSNFLSDPFAISTVLFGIISWIIAVAGAGALKQSSFPHFLWWGIVYQIVIILIVLLLYLNNNIELYKFTLVGLVSVAFVYTTNTTNSLIYNSKLSGNLCCAAGCILLSILDVIWILYFGGHPESPTNQFIDSFSVKHNHGHLPTDERKDDIAPDANYKVHSPVNLPPGQPAHFQDNNLRQSQLTHKPSLHGSNPQPYMSLSQLNGLENFSLQDVHQRDLTKNNAGSINDITFRYKARALYLYDANPDDINEISFVKDEILEVDDIDGKWWQARRANGQVGICPSNYVKLLD